MKREAMNKKVLILGVDGMDPRLTRKFLKEGVMPNVQKYIDAGSAREDLVLLGGHPTVTPAMWTTLATGCYANVHGITAFFRQSKEDLSCVEYNFDSSLCKAEPLWNKTVKSGLKTLVWHWPGSSWPPTSDNENLYVVDGTSPGAIGMAVATVDDSVIINCKKEISKVTFIPKAATEATAPCVINDLEMEEQKTEGKTTEDFVARGAKMCGAIVEESQRTSATIMAPLDMVQSPIGDAKNWSKELSDGAKEFTVLLSHGLIHRPGLILKDEDGKYSRVELYRSKKDEEPLAVLPIGKMVIRVTDEAFKRDKKYTVQRNFKVLSLDPNAESMILSVSRAIDITNDTVWHPRSLFKTVTEHTGYPIPMPDGAGQDPTIMTDIVLDNWNEIAKWQSDSLLYLIENEDFDVIFSHLHNVDDQMHKVVSFLADKPVNRQPFSVYEDWVRNIYKQTDEYFGRFFYLLDKGWTIFIVSDHGLTNGKYEVPFIQESAGVSVPIMRDLGYTVMKKGEDGKDTKEIDWSKTRAVAIRELNIYINLKGRDSEGIVDPKDKYELEEQIMTDLYGLRDPVSHKRVIACALRNKDAILLGYGGPECGDIVYWIAEGYNYDHSDGLSTGEGEGGVSVSPIFIAAGKGIKKGYTTDRHIREVDVAPTVAVICGADMPAQCEGAPVYQIFE